MPQVHLRAPGLSKSRVQTLLWLGGFKFPFTGYFCLRVPIWGEKIPGLQGVTLGSAEEGRRDEVRSGCEILTGA